MKVETGKRKDCGKSEGKEEEVLKSEVRKEGERRDVE